jgi:hypothetical protein
MERSRHDISVKVVENLKNEQLKKNFNIERDLIVFDNGSTVDGSIDLLTRNFANVYRSPTNNGYWSAIDHVLNNFEKMIVDHERFKYIHVMESDLIYYALEKFDSCETALENNPDIGSIRLQEYDVNQQHLYNKTLQHPLGRRYAWEAHINHVTQEKIRIQRLEGEIYDTNFLTKLCSLNQLDTMCEIFQELSNLDQFTENDFQRMYHSWYPRIGLLDGGLYHGKLGHYETNPGIVTGSWSTNLAGIGYKPTRIDRIVKYDKVEKL